MVVVDWANKTKTTRQQPFKPYRHAVVIGDWTFQLYAVLSELPEGRPLSTWSTAKISRHLSDISGRKLTAHSLKRGALDVLLKAVADGLVDGETVSRLAKHAAGAPVVPTTVRYAGNMLNLALAQGTQHASKLL
jgi:hypothetical protein